MHLISRMTSVISALGILAVAHVGFAVDQWESSEIEIIVEGTSTLHDWTVESRTATGGFDLAGEGWVRIPARSLSGGPSGLNDRMYAALKADAHAEIVFELLDLRFPADSLDGVMPRSWPVTGRLTVAGVAREITLAPEAVMQEDGRLRLEVGASLKMTDFGIAPPRFMGLIRTGDEVSVRIRWFVEPKDESKSG